jgi:hypothetical protein
MLKDFAFSFVLEIRKDDDFTKTRQESETPSKLETDKPPTFNGQSI